MLHHDSGIAVEIKQATFWFQNGSRGFAASHSPKPGNGAYKIPCALEMSSDVSGARGGPGKSLAEPA